MAETKRIELSPTTLSLFSECPRCFWLAINDNTKRPSGPFPSLPGGLDNLIKKYFDRYRAQGLLPPEIDGKVQGRLLPDQDLLDNWRNWRRGLRFEDPSLGAALRGALDECLVDDGLYIAVDYKTRGYDLKDDSTSFYQNQLDCYTLLLQENGYKTGSLAYLVYYIPKSVSEKGTVNFDVQTVRMGTDPDRARSTLRKAVEVLRKPIPASHGECDFCAWMTLSSD